MPTPYELDLTAAQVNEAVNAAYDTTGPVLSGSTKLVRGDAVYNAIVAERKGGWAYHADSNVTVGSATTSSVRNQLLIDSALSSTDTTQNPEGSTIWAGNAITPVGEKDVYGLRVQLQASVSTLNAYCTLSLDISAAADGSNAILLDTLEFPKGASIYHPFTRMYDIFVGSTFIANGGRLFITPSTGDVSHHSRGVLLTRKYWASV